MKKYYLLIMTSLILTACSGEYNRGVKVELHKNTEHIKNKLIDEISENVFTADDVEKNIIAAVCEKMKAIDVTIRESPMDITLEVDTLYREAYLNILKSKIPTTNNEGEKEYFKDLYKMGKVFDEIPESYTYYYNDLDGDGLPELGIQSAGYTYILKYQPEKNEFDILFYDATMYYTILGTGQIGYHDGLLYIIRLQKIRLDQFEIYKYGEYNQDE